MPARKARRHELTKRASKSALPFARARRTVDFVKAGLVRLGNGRVNLAAQDRPASLSSHITRNTLAPPMRFVRVADCSGDDHSAATPPDCWPKPDRLHANINLLGLRSMLPNSHCANCGRWAAIYRTILMPGARVGPGIVVPDGMRVGVTPVADRHGFRNTGNTTQITFEMPARRGASDGRAVSQLRSKYQNFSRTQTNNMTFAELFHAAFAATKGKTDTIDASFDGEDTNFARFPQIRLAD